MRAYVIDIETVGFPLEQLNALMPPEVANPIMPEAVKNPPPADLSKCPAYGGSLEKRAAWMVKAELEWSAKADAAQSAWEEKAIEAKQKFIDDAVLSPITASIKLIGIKDVVASKVYILVVGASAEQQAKLDAGKYPCKVQFDYCVFEKDALGMFSRNVNDGAIVPGTGNHAEDYKLITFYGNNFDFPFIFKRCWMNGVSAPWSLRRGRYWNDSVSVDLYDIFTFGDRSQKTGGLDGIAKVLGTKKKSGSGEFFYQLWEKDPVAAVLYLIDDLSCVEEAALKMGVIHQPKAKS